VLLACLVLAVIVTVAVRAGHHARPAGKAPAPSPAVRVTSVGHQLLGVTAGWQLFARGPEDPPRIQFVRGCVTRTYVPPLETASPDVGFVTAARRPVIGRLRYGLSYQDVEELLAERGVTVDHVTVYRWVQRVHP
jgi:hypothetical protein